MPEDPRSAVPGGTWSAPLDQLRLALQQPVLAALPDVGVIAAGGPDAAPFLNGQLTVDVTAVDPRRWQLGAYCSVKGRVIALFEILRSDDGFLLVLPAEQVGALRTTLTRYLLRSKASLVDAGSQWSLFGLTGPGIEAALQAAGLQLPDQPWTWQMQEGGARLGRVPASPRSGTRLMLLIPAAAVPSWQRKLGGLAPVDAGVWWWSKIDAGLPDVFNATQERFVPQTLNLDVLGGVQFGKGCYTGQEVVARSQYRGRLHRRMVLGHAAEASAAADIFGPDEGSGPVGTVVMAAQSPDGGVDLLLQCPGELTQGAQLRVGQERSAPLSLRELPYPMINPTA